jgi:hypothetical protein
MGLISHTNISLKSCAILNDGRVSHMFFDPELFASVNIVHGMYDENSV